MNQHDVIALIAEKYRESDPRLNWKLSNRCASIDLDTALNGYTHDASEEYQENLLTNSEI